MFAHIRGDLPRAISYVFLKFYGIPKKINSKTGRVFEHDDFKSDFDIMNIKVFPAVIDQMAKSRTDIIPSISRLVPQALGIKIFNSFAEDRGLMRERDEAWKFSRQWSSEGRVQNYVRDILKISSSVTQAAIL
jgi:hypothetical protein